LVLLKIIGCGYKARYRILDNGSQRQEARKMLIVIYKSKIVNYYG
jgi:hypothetical protein